MANFNVTLPAARVSPLILNERDNGGSSIRVLVLFSDVAVTSATGATDTVTVAIGNTPASWCVSSAYAVVTTAFAGTGALTLQAGTTSQAAAFLAATSVLTAGLIQPSTGINTTASIANSTGSTSLGMQLLFTNATSGSPSALSAGALSVFLSIIDLSAFY